MFHITSKHRHSSRDKLISTVQADRSVADFSRRLTYQEEKTELTIDETRTLRGKARRANQRGQGDAKSANSADFEALLSSGRSFSAQWRAAARLGAFRITPVASGRKRSTVTTAGENEEERLVWVAKTAAFLFIYFRTEKKLRVTEQSTCVLLADSNVKRAYNHGESFLRPCSWFRVAFMCASVIVADDGSDDSMTVN